MGCLQKYPGIVDCRLLQSCSKFLDIFPIDKALKFKHLYFLVNLSYKITCDFNYSTTQPINHLTKSECPILLALVYILMITTI